MVFDNPEYEQMMMIPSFLSVFFSIQIAKVGGSILVIQQMNAKNPMKYSQ